MKRRLKTLFYGVTHEHACGKFETLKRLADDFEVVALVDDRPRGTPRSLDERLDVEQAVRDGFCVISEAEARKLTDIDVAFVETANADLMEIAATFIAKGVPLHCDKPCGEAPEPYRSLVETCRAANLPFQIGYMYRGNPALQFAWKFVADGGLGDVAFIEADMNHDYGEPNYPDYIASFKGGILYNLGCHLIDFILPMMPGLPARAHVVRLPAPGDPADAGTNCVSVLEWPRATVTVRTARHAACATRWLRIQGTKGAIDLRPIERFDGKDLSLTMTADGAVRTVSFGVQADRYAGQLLRLASIIRGEVPNDQDYDRDLRTHEITLKACGLL